MFWPGVFDLEYPIRDIRSGIFQLDILLIRRKRSGSGGSSGRKEKVSCIFTIRKYSGEKEMFKMADTALHSSAAKRQGNQGVRYVAVTGVLSAAAFVLMLIEIPLPMLIPSFIKFDFSDLPALIGSFAMGPVCGILIELIKNLLHALVSQSFGVGEISNFVLGAVFVGVAGLIYKFNKTKKGAVIASLVGAVSMALISIPSNIFVVYPVYYNFMPKETILAAYQAIIPSMKSVEQSIMVFNAPFTLAKGLVDVLITFLIYKHISPILKGRN